MVRCFVTILLLVVSPFGMAKQWRTLAAMPQAVQEIYPAVYQGKIYVAGGLSDDLPLSEQQMTDLVQIYDPATNSWALGPALPEARHHAYLVSVQEQLFLFGGFLATLRSHNRCLATACAHAASLNDAIYLISGATAVWLKAKSAVLEKLSL